MVRIFKFDSIKRLGRKPPAIRTIEEGHRRLEEMRSWTSGPINGTLSYLVQIIAAVLYYVFLNVFNKVTVLNREKLRRYKPPYIFISNHLTMFDDFFLGALLYLPFAFRGTKYFPWHAPEEQNFFLGPVITWILKKARCVPLTRGHGVFQPGMTRLKELLEGENIVQIYPEGTRSRTGEIGRGKVGVGRLAYQSKSKIIPCYHEGTQDILPIGRHWMQTGKKMAVIVGDPVDMSDLYREKEGRETYQKIADRMIEAIIALRRELHERGFGLQQIPARQEG